jgi:hypothetical protein
MLHATTYIDTSLLITGNVIEGVYAENEFVYISPELLPVGDSVMLIFLRGVFADTVGKRSLKAVIPAKQLEGFAKLLHEVHETAVFALFASLIISLGSPLVTSSQYSQFALLIEVNAKLPDILVPGLRAVLGHEVPVITTSPLYGNISSSCPPSKSSIPKFA